MINERTKAKLLNNRIYKKNNKARGQTLRLTRKKNNNKIPSKINNNHLYSYENNISSPDTFISNIEQKNILDEKKYFKKSVNKKLPNKITNNKILASYHINTNNYPKQNNNINNIFTSLNKNTFEDISKKHPSISLINNSLILNYMNKINNTISVNSNTISLNTNNIRSSMTSLENSNKSEIKSEIKSEENICTPNYERIKCKRINIKKNNNINNENSSIKKSGKINDNGKINKYNFKIRNVNPKINNPFSIEKLIDIIQKLIIHLVLKN